MTLDEPKGTTENTTPTGQASSSDTRTPEKEPKLFTEEQVEEAKQLERIKAGREAKVLEAREKAVQTALAKAEKLQVDMKADADKKAEQKYQDDLAKADGDPITIRNIKLARELETVRAELGNTKTELGKRDEELTDARKVVAESTKERNAREIASKYEVDAELLKLTDGSVEAMEALAKTLSGKEIKTLKPDGSKTIGGSASFERIRDEMIKNPSNDAKMQRYLEAKKQRDAQR